MSVSVESGSVAENCAEDSEESCEARERVRDRMPITDWQSRRRNDCSVTGEYANSFSETFYDPFDIQDGYSSIFSSSLVKTTHRQPLDRTVFPKTAPLPPCLDHFGSTLRIN